MPGTVKIAGLRFSIPGQRKPSLLGWPSDNTLNTKYDKPRRGRALRPLQLLRLALALAVLAGTWFWWYYELHIEIQLYSRNWIRKAILPTPPLSSTCFAPTSIAASAYNSSLAAAPKFIELHAGMGMQLGADCFDFAATIPREPLPGMILPAHTIYHAYWRADLLPLSRRQVSLLHSILAMQDRESTSVILWTNADTTTHLRDSPLLVELHRLYGPDRFAVREINKRALARDTPLDGSSLLDMADRRAWLDGDLVRILVLWAHGGTWVDMDTVMTGRDMRVLGESEWVTQWDCYDKVYQPLNGAMMHFFENSPFLCEMMYAMAHDPAPRKGTTDWGSNLYHKVWRRLIQNGITPFKILPYCFTDGYSCRLDNRLPDPFASRDYSWGTGRGAELRRKVGSVWAVHLHNQWDKQFPSKGWVRTLILDKVGERVKAYKKTGRR